jgi:hypothetical protein
LAKGGNMKKFKLTFKYVYTFYSNDEEVDGARVTLRTVKYLLRKREMLPMAT